MTSTDRVSTLPLETIIGIMQHGLQQDRHFVLRASWTCRAWYELLVHHCPELWGTFDLPWEEHREKAYEAERQAWIDRSGGKFHTINFRRTTFTGVDMKIPKKWTPYLARTKRLHLGFWDNGGVWKFCDKFSGKLEAVQHLSIDAGRGKFDKERFWSGKRDLAGHLLTYSGTQSLKSIAIQKLDYRDHSNPNRTTHEYFHGRHSTAPSYFHSYPQLLSLTVFECGFDVFAADLRETKNGSVVGQHRSCVLHRTLLGAASALQHLEVLCHPAMDVPDDRRQRMSQERITMANLKTIAVPPPAVWAIDVVSSKVTSLDFILSTPQSRCLWESLPTNTRAHLIPDIRDSPVDVQDLFRLTTLGFEFCSSDTASRLDMWLSRVPNLTKLTLRGNREVGTWPPERERERQHMCLGQALLQNPTWMPALTELSLINCNVSDEHLVEFVKLRRDSATMAPLTKLVIQRLASEQMSPETHAWLEEAVPGGVVFEIYRRY
jgi:hypothetical protein